MILKTTPDSNDLWKGIGGYFDSLGEILCEFIDNSISNFRGNRLTSKSIVISIKECSNRVQVKVEDSGTGIKKLEEAFTLGSHACAESPLNEHGFGFKHALASANPMNNDWVIETCTIEDAKKNVYKRIKAPYTIGAQEVEEISGVWTGDVGKTGTIVKFSCSKEMFRTIKRGLRGNFSFSSIIEILAENLGFIYCGVLKDQGVTISILVEEDDPSIPIPINVKPIEPMWNCFCGPRRGTETYDLGAGDVQIDYTFGRMKDHDTTKKYYKRNMTSSGVEIRINGRVLAYNMFKEIWQKENHPSYNQFLSIIDIKSDDASRLPKTKTSKNGLRKGDEILEALFDWISKKMPADSIPKNNDLEPEDRDELDMFEELEKAKKIHWKKATITREQMAYDSLGERIRMDLCITEGQDVYIYEGKKDKSKLLDVYQLLMYWDGYIFDHPDTNKSVTEAILIASEHPESVKNIIPVINERLDSKGNKYNLILRTWKEEGVDYPN